MRKTGHKERALSVAIHGAAEALTLDEVRGDLEGSIKHALDAHLLSVIEFDENGSMHPRAGDMEQLGPEVYFPHFAGDDPITAILERRNPRLLAAGRHLERAHFERSAVYNEYYRPREFERVLCTRVGSSFYYARDERGRLVPAPGMVIVALFRTRSQSEFTPADVRALTSLLPAMEALVRRSRRAVAQQSFRRVLSSMLEHADPSPRIAVDRAGVMLWASSRAEQLLAHFGSGPRALPDALTEAARRVASLQSAEVPVIAVELTAPNGTAMRAELHLERTPSGEPFVVVDLKDLDRPTLASRYGLTHSEAAVLNALGLGLSNQEIACRQFISVSTVKTHVHRILAKLGVSSRLQAALVARRPENRS